MVTGVKGQGEIEFGVFALFPCSGTDSSNFLTVNKDDTSSTEIGWSEELIDGGVISDWEDNSVIVTKIRLDFGFTDLLVTDFEHFVHSFGAVSSLAFFVQSSLEVFENDLFFGVDGGLGEDRTLF